MSLGVLSNAIGWLYTIAWSASFYPQIWLNWKRKSVTGLSFEYQAYNITGFLFYGMYCYSNFIVQHDSSLDLTQSVEVNDLVFVTHAILMTSITIWQCVQYKLTSHTLNKWHLYIVTAFWLLLAYNLGLCAGGILPFVNKTRDYKYTVCEFFGYVKVCISFIKYCPQAYMNWARKSTVGFAVRGVLLDLAGGLLSFGQQSLEAYREGNTNQFTSNATKLLLSLESIAFVLLFLTQHFILYRQNNAVILERMRAEGVPLSREEAEALEAETQARAKAAAAAMLGSVVAAVTDAPLLTGYDSLDSSSSRQRLESPGRFDSTSSPIINSFPRAATEQDGGSASASPGPASPDAALLGNAGSARGSQGQVDMRALGSSLRERDTDSQRSHLLGPAPGRSEDGPL